MKQKYDYNKNSLFLKILIQGNRGTPIECQLPKCDNVINNALIIQFMNEPNQVCKTPSRQYPKYLQILELMWDSELSSQLYEIISIVQQLLQQAM